MPRQQFPIGYPTTTDDMQLSTRQQVAQYQTPPEAAAADAITPPVRGQLRQIVGALQQDVITDPVSGETLPGRDLGDYRMDHYDGNAWVEDGAILPATLAMGFELAESRVDEPGTGTTTHQVKIGLNRPADPGGLTIYVSTTDGTATAGTDYITVTRQAVTIGEGELEGNATITINARQPGVVEGEENLFLTIVDATLGDWGTADRPAYAAGPRHTITIASVTGPIRLTMSDQTVTEGDTAEFEIVASRPSTHNITATANLQPPEFYEYSGLQIGVPSRDTTFSPNSPVLIAAGSRTAKITVPTINSAAVNLPRYIHVNVRSIIIAGGTDTLAAGSTQIAALLRIDDTEELTTGISITIAETYTEANVARPFGSLVLAPTGIPVTLNTGGNAGVAYQANFIIRSTDAANTHYYYSNLTQQFVARNQTSGRVFSAHSGRETYQDGVVLYQTLNTNTGALSNPVQPADYTWSELRDHRYQYVFYTNPVGGTLLTSRSVFSA